MQRTTEFLACVALPVTVAVLGVAALVWADPVETPEPVETVRVETVVCQVTEETPELIEGGSYSAVEGGGFWTSADDELLGWALAEDDGEFWNTLDCAQIFRKFHVPG